MKLLAIDTATQRCSVALGVDEDVRERAATEPRAHADNVLPFVDALLAEAQLRLTDLDAIAFGHGPGGFTGLRVAASVAQGLAFGAGLAMVSVSDLAALAYGAFTTHAAPTVVAALDARMGELYYGAYQCNKQGVTVLAADALAAPEAVHLPAQTAPYFAAGPGWSAYAHTLPAAVSDALGEADEAVPSARFVARLGAIEAQHGRTIAPDQAIPVYLRDNIAQKTTQRRQA